MSKLNTILADCFILDMNMNIAALGHDMESLMGVSIEEIGGEPFANLCMESNLQEIMEEKLRAGYFIDFDATLWTRGGEACKVSLSGFYLGFISDINGYIVLRAKLNEDCAVLKKELLPAGANSTLLFIVPHTTCADRWQQSKDLLIC